MNTFLNQHYGETLSIAAACIWAVSSLIFARVATEIGAANLNRLRLALATVFLAIIITFSVGWSWLSAVTSSDLALLFLSGIIGLTIGDHFYFSALKEMGPRHTTQLFALHPVASTIIAWFALSENLSILTLLGICVAIVGTILVASERRRHEPDFRPASLKGILYTVLATTCHAVGFVIAKYVMATKISALTGGFLRMLSATVAIWIGAFISGQIGSAVGSLSTPIRIRLILAGSLLGPTLGVWAALEGITHTSIGVASTLIALTPILIIPLVAFIHKERLSARAIVGALIAFLGVAIIFTD